MATRSSGLGTHFEWVASILRFFGFVSGRIPSIGLAQQKDKKQCPLSDGSEDNYFCADSLRYYHTAHRVVLQKLESPPSPGGWLMVRCRRLRGNSFPRTKGM
jgi:hypothetical protein